MEMKLFMGTVCAALLLSGSVVGGEEMPRPERILSGYSGFFLGQHKAAEMEKLYFTKMKEAGFTSVELKIQQNQTRRMDVMKYEADIAELAHRAAANGLWFQIYLYPEHYSGNRIPDWPEHRKLPSFVDENGTAHSNTFSLIDYEVWKETFRHAFAFAELSRKYPIGALKFDIETISNTGISYDDRAWRLFAASHPDFPAETPAAERVPLLKKKDAMKVYSGWFMGEFDKVVRRLETELHAINPQLSLGVMPATHGWMSDAFIRLLGTAGAPAVIDDWSMYNGEGFNSQVIAARDAVKRKNPHNLYVPWFRINSYSTAQLASNVYHAAVRTDGYSNWTMAMIAGLSLPSSYALPAGETAEKYFAAYRTANQAVAMDIREKTLGQATRIPFVAVKALVPPLNYSRLTIPELVPSGNGDLGSGQQEFVLRDQRTLLIYAEAGREIKIKLRHLAGQNRPLALQYAVLDREKKVLRNEAISPSGEETFTVRAPYTGMYALVVTGGNDGQAWYSVQVFNPYFAFDARGGVYFFSAPVRFYTTARVMTVDSSERQAFSLSLNAGKPQVYAGKQSYRIDSLSGMTQVDFAKPNPPLSGYYTQDFIIRLPGERMPLLFASPERVLKPAE